MGVRRGRDGDVLVGRCNALYGAQGTAAPLLGQGEVTPTWGHPLIPSSPAIIPHRCPPWVPVPGVTP